MEYSNQEIPEGINYTQTHPLKEFAVLTTGVIVVLGIVFLILSLLADKVAHYIPYSYEKDIDSFVDASDWPDPELHAYMQGLADRICADLDLPEGMEVTVHYSDVEMVNAYATLGGHVVFFKGLLEKVPNENALSMVMAHEIAHIKHRHPIRSLGKSMVIAIAVSMISSSIGDSMVSGIVGSTGTVALLNFSREHEEEADELAIKRLTQLYGHVYGGEKLFKLLKEESGALEKYQVPFLMTHPGIDSRIERVETAAAQQVRKDEVALPDNYFKWLGKSG